MSLSDRAVSYLRTAVPILWGTLIGLLVQSASWLPAPVIAWLSGEAAVGVVTAGAIALWYAAWRWAEPRIPDWLTRVVLGSAQAPRYSRPYAILSPGELDDMYRALAAERVADDGHARWQETDLEAEATKQAEGNNLDAWPYVD